MSYYICGIGIAASGLTGCGRDIQNFDPDFNRPLTVNRKDLFDKPYKPFGRMDNFSKIGFAGIYFSFKDSIQRDDKSNNSYPEPSISIIAATRFGCLDTDKNFFDTMKTDNGKNASPALFAYTLPNTFLGEASIFLNATGETFVLKENDLNGIDALKMSLDILNSETSDFVICGVCDAPQSDFIKKNLKILNTPFTGSLFLTISRIRTENCYGEINEDENGLILFNDMNIMSIFDLAKACIGNNQINVKEKLLL